MLLSKTHHSSCSKICQDFEEEKGLPRAVGTWVYDLLAQPNPVFVGELNLSA